MGTPPVPGSCAIFWVRAKPAMLAMSVMELDLKYMAGGFDSKLLG